MKRLSYFDILWRTALVFAGTSLGMWALAFAGLPGPDAANLLIVIAAVYTGATILLVSPVMAWFMRYSTVEVDGLERDGASRLLAEQLQTMGYALAEREGDTTTFTLARGFGAWRWPICIVERDSGISVVGPLMTVQMLLRRSRAAEGK